jgi:acyl-CoA synthetase (AMP-forming)/AMP-acid ligase II
MLPFINRETHNAQNLFPVQIENVLTSSLSIREAAVVAVPNAVLGEVVGAWIVLEDDHERIHGRKMSREDVRELVTSQMNPQVSNPANSKTCCLDDDSKNAPRYVWFVGDPENAGADDALPKTASGKVMKHVLREWSRRLAQNGLGDVLCK